MKFGDALEYTKTGHRISRWGWNGKGMWVCYMAPMTVPEELVNGRTKAFVRRGDLRVGGYFVMWTADGTWQPGWVPSQADMLADDWSVQTGCVDDARACSKCGIAGGVGGQLLCTFLSDPAPYCYDQDACAARVANIASKIVQDVYG